jgi:hypothetical protein
VYDGLETDTGLKTDTDEVYEVSETLVPKYTTYCDGISRLAGFTSKSEISVTRVRQAIAAHALSRPEEPPFEHLKPSPTCTIGTSVCVQMMRSASSSWLLDRRPRANTGLFPIWTEPCVIKGCHNYAQGPTDWNWTPTITTERCGVDICPEPCQIHADHFALLYWPQSVESRDICASDWFGTDRESASILSSGKPMLYSTKEIVLTKMNTGPEPGDEPLYTTLSGDWTFTSPTIYIAYNTLQATRCGNVIGKPFSSGVFAAQPHQVSSIIQRFPDYHNGSGRALMEVFLNGWPGGQNFSAMFEKIAFETRSFNFADLKHPVPAAAWIYGNLDRCLKQPDDCSTIDDDVYYPFINIDRKVFLSMEPAWSTCLVGQWGFIDPPKELPTTSSLPDPTLPVFGALNTPIALSATQGGSPILPTPAPTPLTIPPIPLSRIPKPLSPIMVEEQEREKQAQNDGTQNTGDYDSEYGSFVGIPSGRLGSYIRSAASAHITTPPQLRTMVVLGSVSLEHGGPEMTIEGKIVKVLADGQGVLVNGHTISFRAIAGPEASESHASKGDKDMLESLPSEKSLGDLEDVIVPTSIERSETAISDRPNKKGIGVSLKSNGFAVRILPLGMLFFQLLV